ncbi:hypothetical protein D1871_04515 [Nakamurella silvestris]|nr:hypothetical protein D1871_04515 [Nakamurella silvestris]
MSKSRGTALPLTDADIGRWERFVLKTATCWVWMGAVGQDGYGRFSLRPEPGGKQRTVTPHQVAAFLATGGPGEGETVLHDCDFRLCCRYVRGHVRVSTQAENMQQAAWRGRARGHHPGLVDVRGPQGVARAVQDALDLAEDRTPEDLADVLAATLALGDPLAGNLSLFDLAPPPSP